MLYFLQQLLNGVHSAAIYGLLAFGYALGNGLLQRTNLAYGGIFAFCGQTMILAAVYGYQALWLTLPATIAFGGVVALAYAALLSRILSQTVFAPLASRSPNAIVAATLGVMLALMELSRIAADTHDYWLPPMLATPLVFASDGNFIATLTVIQLINTTVAAIVVTCGAVLVARSNFGRHWRAVADDAFAAKLCGIHTTRVFHRALLFGGLCAGLAGVLAALYYGNLGFGAGLVYGLKILFITAVGGYYAPGKAALGATAFGIAESLWAGYFPIEWRDAWMYGLLAAMLVLAGDRKDAPSAA
ncbi:branched-chain amino acid ABC transporter permease [Aminobacter anthyllidis]|uniref:Branched-chain amino acid ABC transporter permease n=1 Tax=Aminobacter anthyllidis TaxID=1035067 RepID=A0A9X1AGX1_9HYPH|nr:branched-chain amino acid ABC transporter permease [Aminobacter anthyllidis]MBT1159789.1 branched-chain amino acid ABC transporter permease [Aminobacter anthyllidis]